MNYATCGCSIDIIEDLVVSLYQRFNGYGQIKAKRTTIGKVVTGEK